MVGMNRGCGTYQASCHVSRVITQTSNPLSQARRRRESSSSSSWGQYNYFINIFQILLPRHPIVSSSHRAHVISYHSFGLTAAACGKRKGTGRTWNHLSPSCPFTWATSSIELDPAVESIYGSPSSPATFAAFNSPFYPLASTFHLPSPA